MQTKTIGQKKAARLDLLFEIANLSAEAAALDRERQDVERRAREWYVREAKLEKTIDQTDAELSFALCTVASSPPRKMPTIDGLEKMPARDALHCLADALGSMDYVERVVRLVLRSVLDGKASA